MAGSAAYFHHGISRLASPPTSTAVPRHSSGRLGITRRHRDKEIWFHSFRATAAKTGAAAAKSAADTDREALISVQRAFMIPVLGPNTTTDVATPSGTQTLLNFSQGWENTGATTAPEIITYYKFDVIPDKDFDAWPFTTPVGVPYHKTFAGPHRKMMAAQTVSVPVDLFLHKTSDVHMVFWGWLAYRDIFPRTEPHLTEFCSDLVELATTNDNPKQYVTNWNQCARHNCTDYGCGDYRSVTANLKD